MAEKKLIALAALGKEVSKEKQIQFEKELRAFYSLIFTEQGLLKKKYSSILESCVNLLLDEKTPTILKHALTVMLVKVKRSVLERSSFFYADSDDEGDEDACSSHQIYEIFKGKLEESLIKLFSSESTEPFIRKVIPYLFHEEGVVSSEQVQQLNLYLKVYSTCEDDQVKTSILYAIEQLEKSCYIWTAEQNEMMSATIKEAAEQTKHPFLAFVAKVFVARSKGGDVDPELVSSIIDCATNDTLEGQLQSMIWTRGVSAAKFVAFSLWRGSPLREVILEILTAKLVGATTETFKLTRLLLTLCMYVFPENEKIMPGYTFHDLQRFQQTALNCIARLPESALKLEQVQHILQHFKIPDTAEELQQFVTAKEQVENTKRIPKFDKMMQVRWDMLHHAYGPASDVPDLIIALASANKEARERARWSLHCNIYHQGSRYEATPVAIPFLIELLEYELVEEKPLIIKLLINLLLAFPEEHEVAGINKAEFYLSEETPAQDQGYVELNNKILKAIEAGVPVFIELLNDRDPALRAHACYILAWLNEKAQVTVPVLFKALEDQNELVRSSAMLALSFLLQPETPEYNVYIQLLEKVIASVRDSLCYPVACVSLGRASETIPMPALHGIIHFLKSRNYSRVNNFPWYNGNITDYAISLLNNQERLDVILPLLTDAYAECTGHDGVDIVRAMLSLTFGDGVEPPLDEEQRAVIEALIANTQAFHSISQLLQRYEMPATQGELAKLLQGQQ